MLFHLDHPQYIAMTKQICLYRRMRELISDTILHIYKHDTRIVATHNERHLHEVKARHLGKAPTPYLLLLCLWMVDVFTHSFLFMVYRDELG